MADYDRKPTIIGRDADTADDDTDPIGRFARATKADAGDNVSDSAPPECEDFDIVFEREDFQATRH